MKKTSFFEEWLLILILFYGTGALIPLVLYGPNSLSNPFSLADKTTLRLIWAVFYIGVFGFILIHLNQFYSSVRMHLSLVMLSVLGVLSALWSREPDLALQYSVTTAIGGFIGIYIGSRFSVERIVYMLAVCLGVAMVCSLVFAIAIPSYGRMQVIEPGAWDGAFMHKNQLGGMAIVGIIAFYAQMKSTTGTAKTIWTSLIVISIVLIAGSRAATPIVASILILSMLFLRPILRVVDIVDFSMTAMFFLAFVFFAIPLVVLFLPELLGALGKDTTLTGRTDLWFFGLRALAEQPFLGYGFDTYWQDSSFYGGKQLRASVGWEAPHIHNSWLQVALDLGLVGLFLFAAVFVRSVMTSVRLASATHSAAHFAVLMFFGYLTIYSISEDIFFLRNSIEHMLMFAFVVAMTREGKQLAQLSYIGTNQNAQPANLALGRSY